MSRTVCVAVLMLVSIVSCPSLGWAQDDEAQPATWEPKVAFSAEQSRMCPLDVGDEFPTAELTNLAGDDFDLAGALADGWTLVAFWNEEYVGGVQIRNHLMRVLGDADNVQVITVYVGDDRQEAEKIVATDPDQTATHTQDSEGALWSEVAKKSQPPRLFLLKGNQIVWLDIEYSQAAEREMLNAIRFHAKG